MHYFHELSTIVVLTERVGERERRRRAGGRRKVEDSKEQEGIFIVNIVELTSCLESPDCNTIGTYQIDS